MSRRAERGGLRGALAALPPELLEDLLEADICGDIGSVRTGRWSKVLAVVHPPRGPKLWLKAASHPYGRQLLRQEALGYRQLAPALSSQYRTPHCALRIDNQRHTALVLSDLPGRRRRGWQFPEHPPTRLVERGPVVAFGPWARSVLAQAGQGDARERMEAAVARLDCERRPLTQCASHGDFSSWNLLSDSRGRLGLLDFEYYAPARPLFFDDMHWWAASLFGRSVRMGLPKLPGAMVRRLPTALWERILQRRYPQLPPIVASEECLYLCFAAYLVDRGANLSHEYAIPDFLPLNGDAEQRRLARLVQHFVEALEDLAK